MILSELYFYIYIHNLFALKIAPTFLPIFSRIYKHIFSTILYTLANQKIRINLALRQRILEYRRHSAASPLSVQSPTALHMKIKYSQNLRFYRLRWYSTVADLSQFLVLDDTYFTVFHSNSSDILTFYSSSYMVRLRK